MAGVSTPALAAAVSEAGGLGALGSATTPPAELLEEAAAVRERTGRPFQLNFFCHRPPEVEPEAAAIAFDEARLEALLEIRPAVASFHFGLPEPRALAAVRDAGIRVLA